MGKKKKSKKTYFKDAFGNTKDKKSKKSGKNVKKSAYKHPSLRNVKPTLSKKDAKENKKIILQPVEIPKVFSKNRDKCNHADSLITVREFKDMTPNYAAYTPSLDMMIDVFGEENIMICKDCYDVLVRKGAVRISIKEAVASLYAYANLLVSNKRMKEGKVRDIAQMKNALSDWFDVAEKLDKMEEDGTFDETDMPSDPNDLSDEDREKLERASRAFTI